MPGVLRISERASLALHAVTFLATRGGEPARVKEVAGALSGSAAHLSKVLQALVRGGLLKGTRGPSGGYRLARPAGEITLLQVVEAVEGPLDLRACLFGTPVCGGNCCLLGGMVDGFNRRLRDHLAGATVGKIKDPFAAKAKEVKNRSRTAGKRRG